MYEIFDYVNVKEGLRWRQLMIDARPASGAIVVFDEQQRWGVLMHSDELNKDMNWCYDSGAKYPVYCRTFEHSEFLIRYIVWESLVSKARRKILKHVN